MIGQNGLELIKYYEGLFLKTYRCPAGVLTIGYGHTGNDVYEGKQISVEEAENLLKQDLQKHANYVKDPNFCYFTNTLNQNQRDALISFCFNLGPGNLRTLCKNRTIETVPEGILLYNKGGGKVLPGLVKRRESERKLFLGIFPFMTQSNNSINSDNQQNQQIIIKKGSRGEDVKWLQKALNIAGNYGIQEDGIFGNDTFDALLNFQQSNGLGADGICGPETKKALLNIIDKNEEIVLPDGILKKGDRGEGVKILQMSLKKLTEIDLDNDGIFGNDTYNALKNFQEINGLAPDGIYGPLTKNKIMDQLKK